MLLMTTHCIRSNITIAYWHTLILSAKQKSSQDYGSLPVRLESCVFKVHCISHVGLLLQGAYWIWQDLVEIMCSNFIEILETPDESQWWYNYEAMHDAALEFFNALECIFGRSITGLQKQFALTVVVIRSIAELVQSMLSYKSIKSPFCIIYNLVQNTIQQTIVT